MVQPLANPPARPLLLYDGDCRFCTLWIHRWQLATGGFVDYLPFQDPRGAARFPEIPREHFQTAVQLILPDGSVFGAAAALSRSLACHPGEQWLWELYQHSPLFVVLSETTYGFVARHRRFFSGLTRLLWGQRIEPPRQNLVRWIFLRAIGVVYLLTFLSLWMQIPGLIGRQGQTPAAVTMTAAQKHFDAQNIGLNRYHLKPTLCWFADSDLALRLQCAAGISLAGLLLLGLVPAPCLFLLWVIQLSLATICAGLPGFQWSHLLLEAGFLAIFFAPLQLWPRAPAGEAAPARLALWLLRWLLFRLLFESGCGQLLASKGVWPDTLFETVTLGGKLILPWAIFLPRRPRQFACACLIVMQMPGLFADTHPLFNLLTVALCLVLLDDAALQTLLPKSASEHPWLAAPPARSKCRWPLAVTGSVLLLVGCSCYGHLFEFAGIYMPGPEPVVAVYKWLEPFRSFNNYRWHF